MSFFECFEAPADRFLVEVAGGWRVCFRCLVGRKALVSLRGAAHRFAESVTEVNCPEALREFMTSDEETLVWVYFLGSLCVDGDAADFLRLQHLSPVVFEFLLGKVQAELGRVAEAV